MASEQTLSIIKPDGVSRNLIGTILARFEAAGLKIVAAKMMHLTKEQAADFYAEHAERPFYASLTEYMCSGPVVVSVLAGDNAIAKNRELMGATNPADADAGTIRADFSENVEQNTVHGSDSPTSAAREVNFFFPELG